jgi:hypothetical protein
VNLFGPKALTMRTRAWSWMPLRGGILPRLKAIRHCNHQSAKPITLKLRAGNACQVRSLGPEIVSNRYKSGIEDDFLTTLHKRPPCMILEPSLISISSDFSSFEKLPERTRDNIV